MLLSAVSVLVVAQSSSEIPEGLMNNPVLLKNLFRIVDAVFDFIGPCIVIYSYNKTNEMH